MDKKLIAIDLDGTLLNSDGIVSEVTKSHLQKLKEKGYIITIATGRILNRALVGTDGAEFTNYIVSDAGAAVFKNNEINKEWEEVYAHGLSKDIAKNISSYYDKDKFITINICDRNKIHHYDQTVNITEFLENINEIIHVSVSFINNEFVEEFLIYSEEIAKWMCSICENKLGNYLSNVDSYLNSYKEAHKGKEDIIFCGRSKNQYYLNMIGAEIMNDVYKESFVNCKEKRVYLPSCMRKDKETCKAIKINEGFKCMKCNKRCSVRTITLIGESKGFDSRIIPHQTSLFDIRGKNEIGVVSIACILNLLAGGWKAIRMEFIPQCVVLEYCGCAHHWCEKDVATEINYSVFREKFIKISK